MNMLELKKMSRIERLKAIEALIQIKERSSCLGGIYFPIE